MSPTPPRRASSTFPDSDPARPWLRASGAATAAASSGGWPLSATGIKTASRRARFIGISCNNCRKGARRRRNHSGGLLDAVRSSGYGDSGKTQGWSRRRRRHLVSHLFPRRRSRRARVLRARHSRPGAQRHVRGDLLFCSWHARLPSRAELGDLQTQLAAARPLPEAILRLMKMLPPSDGMDALRTLTSALGHYDPDAHDNSPQASYRKAVRLTGQIASHRRHVGTHAAGRRARWRRTR